MRIAVYCKCGGALVGRITPDDEARGRRVAEVFRSLHTTACCAPTDSVTARKAREKEEKKAAK
jgi:hypothetical protein